MSEPVVFERRGDVAYLTLNRPEQHNAYDLAMRDALHEALSAIHDDGTARVLVLAGAGRSFCAGADLTEFGTAPSPVAARAIRFARDVWRALDELPVVRVAALHGHVIGSGMELALWCDWRIAATSARFSLPEARLGFVPAAGGTQTLTRSVRLGHALTLALRGRPVDAAQALAAGFVERVVAPEQLSGATEEFVQAVLAAGPSVVRALLRAMREGPHLPLATALKLEARLNAGLRSAA
jgi:enoyl-CoA hydratase/carnithine racemase